MSCFLPVVAPKSRAAEDYKSLSKEQGQRIKIYLKKFFIGKSSRRLMQATLKWVVEARQHRNFPYGEFLRNFNALALVKRTPEKNMTGSATYSCTRSVYHCLRKDK